MREDERAVYVNDYDHRLLVKCLSEVRNALLREKRPTEDVDELLLRVIDAPYCHPKRRERDER